MRVFVFIFGLCVLLIGCKAKKAAPKMARMEISEVSTNAKNRAYELGKRVLSSCNTSHFKPFTTAEATPQLIKNITPEKITKTCQKFRIKYGKFQDIRLVQVLENKSDHSLVFRYKADYQWKHTQKELRVTINSDGKVSAIKSANWADIYQP